MAASSKTSARTALLSPDQAPDRVDGRPGPDPLMRGLTKFADNYLGILSKGRVASGRLRPREPRGPAVSHWRTMVVTERNEESDEVISLRLASPGGGPLRRWYPGAHLQLELPSGTIRHYSLNGDPADRGTYRIAVRRIENGGGGSKEIHDTLTQGTEIRVAGPVNAFPFAGEPAVLLVAGGIGITPILPMARKAAALGLDWKLVYTGRGRATMPFLDEVSALGSRAAILADDETGRPDPAALIASAPARAVAYVCGPPPLLAGVRVAANDAITAGSLRGLHFERFTAPPVEDGHPFEVELKRSGTVLQVPADRSVLDVLRAHNPATPYSCQQGFCGTCKQRVLGGTVDHRDQRLTSDDQEAGDMLVCVSRAPRGERLVLDL
ncbi:MAG TPA: PDR/VanB family oxidoreductase [Trebonia sp.]